MSPPTAAADPVKAIADAVLYEGYILWPYRRSAMKNQQRWTFGGVYPRAHSEGREDDPWLMQTQCLIELGPQARVDVGVRFLQVVERELARRTPSGLEPVDELTVVGRRYIAWQEAVEREVAVNEIGLEERGCRVAIDIPAGRAEEPLLGEDDEPVGAIVRSWRALEGSVDARVRRLNPELCELTVEVANTTPLEGTTRDDALRQTLCSTHIVLRGHDAAFVSLTDPPPHLRAHAEACRNRHTWPVLVGEPPERHTLLSSPIILEDYPRIAPESPGDLFDGGEIDQMLVLNILSLTDDEKAEMRDSDPRAREILERTESLTADQLMGLHGTIREFGLAREP